MFVGIARNNLVGKINEHVLPNFLDRWHLSGCLIDYFFRTQATQLCGYITPRSDYVTFSFLCVITVMMQFCRNCTQIILTVFNNILYKTGHLHLHWIWRASGLIETCRLHGVNRMVGDGNRKTWMWSVNTTGHAHVRHWRTIHWLIDWLIDHIVNLVNSLFIVDIISVTIVTVCRNQSIGLIDSI